MRPGAASKRDDPAYSLNRYFLYIVDSLAKYRLVF